MIDIIIPHYGEGQLLDRCISSISRFTPVELYKLFVVDNNSNNRGFSVAVNQGIYAGNSPYVVILNNDIKLVAGWYHRFLRIVEGNTKIGAVGPLSSAKTQWQSVENILGITSDIHLPSDYITSDDVPFDIWLAFWCVLIPRPILNAVGMLDERFFMYGEDDDWCIRARKAGYLLALDLGLTIHHDHRANYNEESQQHHIESREKFIQKWGELPKRKWLKPRINN